jgi:hypothetical protein
MTNVRWFNWVLVSAVLVVLAYPISYFVQLSMYVQKSRAIRESLLSLQTRRPPAVNAAAWECCVDWAVTAHCNICFSPGHTPYSAMLAFGGQVDRLLERSVDLTTFDHIWERLAETGPNGQAYVEKNRTYFRENLKAAMP